MQGMALCVLYIGVSGCLKGQNTLTAILSIALGAIIGELLDLDRRMRSLGDWVQTRTARLIHTEDGAPSISDGFVTASLPVSYTHLDVYKRQPVCAVGLLRHQSDHL